MSDTRWIAELAARVEREGRVVLVTLANATGSTPREAGTAMIVSHGGVFGTIGGGHLEFEAIRMGRDALADASSTAPWLVRFPLAARLGQCCGGVATLAFAPISKADRAWIDAAVAREREGDAMDLVVAVGAERDAYAIRAASSGKDQARVVTSQASTEVVHTIVPEHWNVLVFGNGHVGRALVRVLSVLPARVQWIDERESEFPADTPAEVQVIATDTPTCEIRDAPRGAQIVITTHDHALDFELVCAALGRDDWRYLGLIGSVSKRNQFEKRLLARGFSAAQVARVTCPIGRAVAIRSKDPGAIAIAVAAELVAVNEQRRSGALPQRSEQSA